MAQVQQQPAIGSMTATNFGPGGGGGGDPPDRRRQLPKSHTIEGKSHYEAMLDRIRVLVEARNKGSMIVSSSPHS
jgi:hypothetical protein